MNKVEINRRIAIKLAKEFTNFIKTQGIKVKSVYLFGSFVKGDIHRDSDIDLAVVLENPVRDIFDEQMKLMRLACRFQNSIIEPHPFVEKDFKDVNPFTSEIKRNGIRIV
jgi:predicted nucleotidyltransferase